jgi:hypothetical protein
MFVHAVYFWLKQDLGHEEKQEFLRRLKALATIESAHSCFIGEPAETRREVIDHTWGMAYVWTASDRGDRTYSLFNFAWNLGFVNSFIAWKENEQWPLRLNLSAP